MHVYTMLTYFMLSFDGELDSELTGILHDEYKGRLRLTVWVLYAYIRGIQQHIKHTYYSDDHYQKFSMYGNHYREWQLFLDFVAVERSYVQCPFLEWSFIRGSTVPYTWKFRTVRSQLLPVGQRARLTKLKVAKFFMQHKVRAHRQNFSYYGKITTYSLTIVLP